MPGFLFQTDIIRVIVVLPDAVFFPAKDAVFLLGGAGIIQVVKVQASDYISVLTLVHIGMHQREQPVFNPCQIAVGQLKLEFISVFHYPKAIPLPCSAPDNSRPRRISFQKRF